MAPEKQLTSQDVEFIDRRINDFDRRQDIHIKEKIEALEKLLNLTITTKADALAVLISRLQTDSKECAIRCVKQVQHFTSVIDEISKRIDNHKIDELKAEVETLKEDKKDLLSRVEALEQWKNGFWVKNTTTAIVSSVALVNIALYGFTWFVDFVSKIVGMKGGPGGP